MHIQGMFSAHSGNVQCTFRERSLYTQGTFNAHSGNVQCTFREHSVLVVPELGSWGKPVPRGRSLIIEKETRSRVVYGASHRVGQLGETGPPRAFP
jgi:hypothetical protein